MSKYLSNLDKKFFGNGDRILSDFGFENWAIEFPSSDSLEIILRTNLATISITKFLSHMFGRIYVIDTRRMKISPLFLEKSKTIYCYRLNFHFAKPHFWSDLEKDFINFYSLHLVDLLNWKFSPLDSATLEEYWINDFRDFESYFRDLLRSRINQVVESNLLFHMGILTYLKAADDSGLTISVSSILDDFHGINRILRTPYKLREAIGRCESFDQTHISDQIIEEYRRMRKNW
jgi:hypothetical protein